MNHPNTRLFLSPPHMGGAERGLVADAFDSNYIAPLGPMVDAFEKEFSAYTNIPHCVALSSGTAATHLALRHLGVGPGDEVLASTLTFIGSVTPVTFMGATPVFVDSDTASWNMDPNLVEQELASAVKRRKLPKAVIPTDLYGQCCNLALLKSICARYDVPVICDSAEAMGARYEVRAEDRPLEASSASVLHAQDSSLTSLYRHAGFDAWASVYSFNGNKIITTSGGGMLASHDKALIDHARKLSQQARDAAPWYEHTEIGYNYRISNILAAIGRGQLQVLDERVRRKREILNRYQALLSDVPGISFMPEAPYGRANRWLTVVLIEPRQFGADTHRVREALERENIESRPAWKPMHQQPVFRSARVVGGRVSEHLFSQGLCLPSGTAMSDSDIERVSAVIRAQRH